MDGIHDLGGMEGFGPVVVERDEPVFHAAWERTVFGLATAVAAARIANTHEHRHAIERMDPAHYLTASYYERWLTALGTLLVEKGVVTVAEPARGAPHFPPSRPAALAPVPPRGARAAGARFAVGDIVRVRPSHPVGHTRCPRYVRGRRGIVVRVDPAVPLPDIAVRSTEPCEEPTYSVRFAARELWGDAASAADAIHVDLWDSYLEAP